MAKTKVLRFATARPVPPSEVDEAVRDAFVPASDVLAWIRSTFLAEGSPLYNPDHSHLADAHIGILWTNITNRRQMKYVVAQAEDPNPTNGGVWKNGRAKHQLEEWFGGIPDFLITLHAPSFLKFDDRTSCAVIEHELYHCAHATNEFDSPKFHNDGSPVFGIRAHDVEEFVGVAARYGLSRELHALLEQAKQQPKVPDAMLDVVCGTCKRMAA